MNSRNYLLINISNSINKNLICKGIMRLLGSALRGTMKSFTLHYIAHLKIVNKNPDGFVHHVYSGNYMTMANCKLNILLKKMN